MKSPCMTFLILMLFAAGTSFCFDASAYLYYSEDGTAIQKESFTLDGSSYDIVSISNDVCFLTRDNSLVDNNEEIYSAIYKYYTEKYYPSGSELNDVYNLLMQYNASRNDGERLNWKEKEENACITALFADGRVKIYGQPVTCINDTTCDLNARLVFQAYKDSTGWGSHLDALSPLKNFSYAHFSTERLMNESFYALQKISEANIYASLEKIKNNIPALRSDLTQIEKNLFRYPNLNDSADYAACKGKCYALCPSFALDEGALNLLDARLDALLKKLKPFNDYATTAAKLSNNTAIRLEFRQNESRATEYYTKFQPLYLRGNRTIQEADAVLRYIVNATHKKDVGQLKSLHSDINKSIGKRNFTSIDSKISEYGKLLDNVNATTPLVYAVYNRSLQTKQKTDSMMFLLDSHDLDPWSRKKVDILKNQTLGLDLVFDDGLQAEEYLSFQSNYSQITEQADVIITEQKQNPVFLTSSKLRGFARKVNMGLAEFVQSANIVATSEMPAQKDNVFISISLITFFSVGALMFLFLLLALLRYRKAKTPTKVAVCVTYLAGVMALVVFTGMLFLYLGKTSGEANVTEFFNDFSGRGQTAIVINLTNVSYTDAQYISSCGASLITAFRDRNMTVGVYKLSSDSCIMQTNAGIGNLTKTPAECEHYIANETSLFLLNYAAASERPVFETVYINKALIRGDTAYYKACPLKTLLPDVKITNESEGGAA